MIFVAGIVIVLLTHVCGTIFLARRGWKLPRHGTSEALPMYWLALGYLLGAACVMVSVGILLWRYLP